LTPPEKPESFFQAPEHCKAKAPAPAAKFEAIPSAQADREARAAKAAEEAKAKEEAKAAKAEAKAAKAAALPSPSRKTRHTKDDAKDD
jgi:hypothetical protein